jgi:hypothetical protein
LNPLKNLIQRTAMLRFVFIKVTNMEDRWGSKIKRPGEPFSGSCSDLNKKET